MSRCSINNALAGLLWAVCALGLIASPAWSQTFTPVASSTFTGTDENPLSEGGVWTDPGGAKNGFKRLSNAAQPTGFSTDAWEIYTGASFNNDQYSRANLTVTGTAGADSGIGLILRKANNNVVTEYRFVIDHHGGTPNGTQNAAIQREVAGVFSSLVKWDQAFADGDQFTLAIAGQVLYAYDKTNTQIQKFDDTGGGGPTTGFPGLGYSSTETSANLDNWEGGNFAPPSSGCAIMLLGVGKC